MEDHGREAQSRRITAERDRESMVRQVHRALEPTLVKGLALTEGERKALSKRAESLLVEIENAPAYEGVVL